MSVIQSYSVNCRLSHSAIIYTLSTAVCVEEARKPRSINVGEREKFLRSHKCDLMLIVPQAYVDSLRKNCLQLSLAEGPVRRSDLLFLS